MSKTEIKKSDSGKLESDLSKSLLNLLSKYLSSYDKYNESINPEFEVRFGTRKIKTIQKIDFNRVIGVLYNFGFINLRYEYCLKILTDNENANNIRTEIYGLNSIKDYCISNNIESIDDSSVKFVEKSNFVESDKEYFPINFDDYNFRIAYQIEKTFNRDKSSVEELIKKWTITKKIFRYIKRFEFTHPELPFKIHCSIVKSSSSNDSGFLITKNIQESNVFNQIENYEIEIEIDNLFATRYSKTYAKIENLHKGLKQVIKYILIGLQNSNYPIGNREQLDIYTKYLKIVKGELDIYSKVNPKDFIGPSSVTLQTINMLSEKDIDDTNNKIPNIRNNYTVTDKADGDRKLMFINDNGLIYLFTTSMATEFTGCKTNNSDIFNTIIDGEHITYDKNKQFLNLYAAFDIYFLNKKNTTGLVFFENNSEKQEGEKAKTKDTSRLVILNSVIKKLNAVSINNTKTPCMQFQVKKFYANNIFAGCATILNNSKLGLFQYETDGLIFTPSNTGVASNTSGYNAPNYRTTWNESFKWKPKEFNTIDFYVKFKKTQLGSYFIGNIHSNGNDLTSLNQIKQYITLVLHVGFDEKRHGYINPCADIINDNIKKRTMDGYKNEYRAAEFYPTNPSDLDAKYCNLLAVYDNTNVLRVYTEDGEEIEDNSIIEFRYDSTREIGWRWIPLRNRYDKTSELRSGFKNYGNAYHVANQNWQSIHNPITDEMIMTGSNIINNMNDDDVYYNKVTNKSSTRSLRDFHNLFVKSLLIKQISKQGDLLIDYAVGKGGDLPKWIHSQLGFILGIDIMRDNIENRLDGACARYLNYATRFTKIPSAIFINGNTSLNIKTGEAIFSEKYKTIVKAVFGEGEKNIEKLGKGIYKNYGVARSGFNISSIQFAIHYMFESAISLNNFLKNVAECTALNGYFVGTCYDGKKIFNMLNSRENGESVSIFKDDKKIWQITKQYNETEFLDDDSCIGYAIDIYQETINQTFREYLVNFDYLTRILEMYGFVPLTNDELREKNLTSSITGFEMHFENMKNSLVTSNKYGKPITQYGDAISMSEEEKTISFLNNSFIYKKIRNYSGNVEDAISVETQEKDKEKQISDNIEQIDSEIQEIITKDIKEQQDKELAKIENTKLGVEKSTKTLSKEEKQSIKIKKQQDKLDKEKAKEELKKKKEQDKLEKEKAKEELKKKKEQDKLEKQKSKQK